MPAKHKHKTDLEPTGSTAEMMHQNCLAEIERVQEEKNAKHQEIGQHHVRIQQLGASLDEAQSAIITHQEKLRGIKEQLADARTRHVVAKNTPAESVIAVKIANLGEQMGDCQRALDNATANMAEHQEALQEVADIKATIGRLEEEAQALALGRTKLERLRDELFQKIGVEKRDQLETALREGLGRLEEIRQSEQKAIEDMADLASKIKIKLSAWPQHMQALTVRYKPDHQSNSPTGRILQAWLAYVQTLEREGTHAEKSFTVSPTTNPFATYQVDLLELLSLDKDLVQSILHFADPQPEAPTYLEPKRRVMADRTRQAAWRIEQEGLEQKTW